MKIGILVTGDVPGEIRAAHGELSGYFHRMLGSHDPRFEFEDYDLAAGDWPGGVHDAAAWVITGSRCGVYDHDPWIAPLMGFVQDAAAARARMIGICFGHQIMAHALGGRAEKSSKGWGLGAHRYRTGASSAWGDSGLGGRDIELYAIHQDQVVVTPPDASVLARSEFCPVAALAYGDPAAPYALSVQPHPEYGADFVRDLLTIRSGVTMPPGDVAAARYAASVDADASLVARWLARFAARAGDA